MSASDANKIITDLLETEVIKMVNQEKYLSKAFEIAVRNRITVYDALFVALARELNVELITSDTKQAEVAEKEGVNTVIV